MASAVSRSAHDRVSCSLALEVCTLRVAVGANHRFQLRNDLSGPQKDQANFDRIRGRNDEESRAVEVGMREDARFVAST